MFGLEERVAAVTGAASGIGLTVATELAAAGAHVVVADIDGARLDEAVRAIEAGGGRAAGVPCDVRRPADTDRMVAAAREAFGTLDVLVNNAGLVAGGALERMTDADWNLVLDVILRGTFNATRSAAAQLRRPAGHNRKVVTISSVAGVHGGTTVNYSAAKAGQIGLTKALAREWAGDRVNVNAIAPGRIGGTRIGSHAAAAPIPMPDPEIPIGRTGTPEDVAWLVRFLAVPASDYLTGQVLELHGGLEVMPRPDDQGAAGPCGASTPSTTS